MGGSSLLSAAVCIEFQCHAGAYSPTPSTSILLCYLTGLGQPAALCGRRAGDGDVSLLPDDAMCLLMSVYILG